MNLKYNNKLKIVIFLQILLIFTCENSPFSLDQIYSNRIIDWKNAGLEGTFVYPSTIYNVTTYGATGNGSTDDTAAFTSAITAATSGGGIVYAPAGSYVITSTLQLPSNVVLRGAGYTNTKLLFTLTVDSTMRSCILLGGTENAVAWRSVIAGYTKGSTQLTLSSVVNFSVGKTFLIREENDPVAMYTTPSWASGYAPTYWDAGWSDNAVRQYATITAIDTMNNTVTIDRPLYLTYKSDLNPSANCLTQTENAGVENLYIERTNAAWGNTISVSYAKNCQIKNVESYNTYNAHILFLYCMRSYAYHNYLHGSHSYSGGCAYGIDFFGATDCLAEDNIIEDCNKGGLMTHVGASGNVIAYNYTTASAGEVSFDTHGHYDNYNLFESNYAAAAVEIADFWGPAGPGTTFFRNKIMSNELTGFGRGSLVVFDLTRYVNLIGNLMMDPTYGVLLINNTEEQIEEISNTLLKHGNYETGAIQWDLKVPLRTIPDSFYLDEKPSFFGTKDWPCYNPSSPTVGTLPAEDRYLSGIYI